MLKITIVQENSEFLRVYLCGQFTTDYVPELKKALYEQSPNTKRVTLDLSNVTFVDREAMMFLCSAKSKEVVIENIPSYVTRWIEQEGRCGHSNLESSEK